MNLFAKEFVNIRSFHSYRQWNNSWWPFLPRSWIMIRFVWLIDVWSKQQPTPPSTILKINTP